MDQGEQEKTCRDANGKAVQVAKYIHGVGDSKNPLVRVIGGATGSGTITRIVRGYTYISRMYEAGDNIFWQYEDETKHDYALLRHFGSDAADLMSHVPDIGIDGKGSVRRSHGCPRRH